MNWKEVFTMNWKKVVTPLLLTGFAMSTYVLSPIGPELSIAASKKMPSPKPITTAKPTTSPKVTKLSCDQLRNTVRIYNQKNSTNATYRCEGIDEVSFQVIRWQDNVVPYRLNGVYHISTDGSVLLSDADYQRVKSYRVPKVLTLNPKASAALRKAIANKWTWPEQSGDIVYPGILDQINNWTQDVAYIPHHVSNQDALKELASSKDRHMGKIIFHSNYPAEVFSGVSLKTTRTQLEKKWGAPSERTNESSGEQAYHYIFKDMIVSAWFASDRKTMTQLVVTERQANLTAPFDLMRWLLKDPISELRLNFSPAKIPVNSTIVTSDDGCELRRELRLPANGISRAVQTICSEQKEVSVPFVFYNNSIQPKDLKNMALWLTERPNDQFVNRNYQVELEERRARLERQSAIERYDQGEYALISAQRSDFEQMRQLYVQKSDALNRFFAVPLPDSDQHGTYQLDPNDANDLYYLRKATPNEDKQNQLMRIRFDVFYANAFAENEQASAELMLPEQIAMIPQQTVGLEFSFTPNRMIEVREMIYQEATETFSSYRLWIPFAAEGTSFQMQPNLKIKALDANKLSKQLVYANYTGPATVRGQLLIQDSCELNNVFLKYNPSASASFECPEQDVLKYAYLKFDLQQSKAIPQYATVQDYKTDNPILRQFQINTIVRLKWNKALHDQFAELAGTTVEVNLDQLDYFFYQNMSSGTNTYPFEIEAVASTSGITKVTQ